MKKIQLTEAQLHNVIKESVKRILKEYGIKQNGYYHPSTTYDFEPFPFVVCDMELKNMIKGVDTEEEGWDWLEKYDYPMHRFTVLDFYDAKSQGYIGRKEGVELEFDPESFDLADFQNHYTEMD